MSQDKALQLSHRLPFLRSSEREALAWFGGEMRMRFGARLQRFALFGSRARGEGNEDSDVDILVLVDDLTDAEARAVGELAGDALTNHDVLLAPLILSSARFAELRARERLIVFEIDRDGVSL